MLHSVDARHHGVSDEEVMRRVCEADENPDVMITFDQLLSGLKVRNIES
jgi:hypothetical protein